ncbi:MAG: hypothetical protein L6R38_005042 [Xanthoria sp. 2 TBL-2021]|nr:MAG: hypothetical protein L6R38_005042 [Xanthoria sp. 2 TBL-2021]
MASTKSFAEAVKDRRTYYALSNESTIPDSRIQEIVKHAILHTPSAFNSQTSRVVVLLGEEHVKTWDIIAEVYKQQLPEEKFNQANKRFQGFRAAYGTILFYEDTDNVREFQDKFKTYEDKFPGWSEQTNGMHQYHIWTALETEGLGVNLQHYNPLIDVRLETEYKVPSTWNLKAQMVFGKPTSGPAVENKEFKPVEDRMKVYGAK